MVKEEEIGEQRSQLDNVWRVISYLPCLRTFVELVETTTCGEKLESLPDACSDAHSASDVHQR